MFLENKYTKWYMNIISQARSDVNRIDGYFEKHHIVPKCIGGSNSKDNIVRLTAKEHFVCHRLLVYMTSGIHRSKMSYAVIMFTRQSRWHHRCKITSRTYESIRNLFAQAVSQTHTGKVVSAETRAKQSASKKLTHSTPDVRAKISNYHRNRPQSVRDKMGLAHRGKTISAEQRSKTSAKVAGELNPRALTWTVEYEDGRPVEYIKSLKSWCRERSIKYLAIYHRATQPNSPCHASFYQGVRAVLTSDPSERKLLTEQR